MHLEAMFYYTGIGWDNLITNGDKNDVIVKKWQEKYFDSYIWRTTTIMLGDRKPHNSLSQKVKSAHMQESSVNYVAVSAMLSKSAETNIWTYDINKNFLYLVTV